VTGPPRGGEWTGPDALPWGKTGLRVMFQLCSRVIHPRRLILPGGDRGTRVKFWVLTICFGSSVLGAAISSTSRVAHWVVFAFEGFNQVAELARGVGSPNTLKRPEGTSPVGLTQVKINAGFCRGFFFSGVWAHTCLGTEKGLGRVDPIAGALTKKKTAK